MDQSSDPKVIESVGQRIGAKVGRRANSFLDRIEPCTRWIMHLRRYLWNRWTRHSPGRPSCRTRHLRRVRRLNEVRKVLSIMRASLLVSFMIGLLVSLPDQAIECHQVLAEDLRTNPLQLLWVSLAALLACLMIWYWARALTYMFAAGAVDAPGLHGKAARHLPRMLGTVPLLAMAIGSLRAFLNVESGGSEALTRPVLTALCVLSLAGAALLYLFFVKRTEWFGIHRPSPSPTADIGTYSALERSTSAFLFLYILLAIALFAAFSLSDDLSVGAKPLAILLASASLWVAFLSILRLIGLRLRIQTILLVFGAAILFSVLDLNDNHAIRVVPRSASAAPTEPANFDDGFKTWLNNRTDARRWNEAPYPVVLVCAEGGGIYAAYFTARVLAALEEANPNFSRHVFAISGVSGGSVGAGIFAGLIAQRDARRGLWSPLRPESTSVPEAVRRVLNNDLLSPVLAAALYPDLVQRFIPFPIRRFDRARALERSFESAWSTATGDSQMSDDFFALWPNFAQGSTPGLFLNTTEVETGERIVISNLRFQRATDDGLLRPDLRRFKTLADVLPPEQLHISLAAAVGLSARFPLVTPAARLPEYLDDKGRLHHSRRLADGGYFDNSGAATLLDILNAIAIDDKQIPDRKPFSLVIIRIGTIITDEDQDDVADDRTQYQWRGLGEALSPVRALMNTRGARGRASVQQLRIAVEKVKRAGYGANMIDFGLDTERDAIPLGWLLSERARSRIDAQLASDPSKNHNAFCAARQALNPSAP